MCDNMNTEDKEETEDDDDEFQTDDEVDTSDKEMGVDDYDDDINDDEDLKSSTDEVDPFVLFVDTMKGKKVRISFFLTSKFNLRIFLTFWVFM